MTTPEQRNADEARGRLSRHLEDKADELSLIIDKKRIAGTWIVEVVSTVIAFRTRVRGATEAEALDNALDQINHMDATAAVGA